MPVREPSRPAAPPLSVGGARIVVRPGGHGAGLRPAAAVPVPDDAFTVTAEREGL